MLKVRRGLITDGFFARTRNPNYLGEMMIYGSFAALSMHWIPSMVDHNVPSKRSFDGTCAAGMSESFRCGARKRVT